MPSEIYTDPKTRAHLRDILSKLKVLYDSLSGGGDGSESGSTIITPTATADATLAVGEVVYVPTAGHVDKAQANTAGASGAVGIVTEAIASGAAGRYQTDGVVTNSGWSLTAGDVYYLSPTTAGALTATAPTTVGQYVVPIGRAISATKLRINILQSVLL